MPGDREILDEIQAFRFLQEVNHYILHNEGEILTAPGKISLVWTDPRSAVKRFLSVKIASDQQVLINGRRYPATVAGLKQGLAASLAGMV